MQVSYPSDSSARHCLTAPRTSSALSSSGQKSARSSARVDVSPEAIDRRLRELGQLYELAMAINGARWLGTLEELQKGPERQKNANAKVPRADEEI